MTDAAKKFQIKHTNCNKKLQQYFSKNILKQKSNNQNFFTHSEYFDEREMEITILYI